MSKLLFYCDIQTESNYICRSKLSCDFIICVFHFRLIYERRMSSNSDFPS
jgi:hypothetical protein